MEVSDVRRRLRTAIEGAKLRAAERRTRSDEATKAYEAVLETVAVPAFHTVVNALVGEGYRFKVTTPGTAVRMSPERSAEEFIEMSLDTDSDLPAVMLRSSRGRGRRAVTSERVLCDGDKVPSLSDEDIVTALLDELLPFIER
jgi:hypothetical protein